MAASPLKRTQSICFICADTLSRTFKLNSKKVNSLNIVPKLNVLLDVNQLFPTGDLEITFICLKCIQKVQNTHSFILEVKTSYDKCVSEKPERTKRGALTSPQTPTTAHKDESIPMCEYSRKMPRLSESPFIDISTSALHPKEQEEDKSYQLDHGYFNTSAIKESNSTLSLYAIQEFFSTITDDPFYEQLRSQTALLTSRTSLISSILTKHRDVSQLQQHADSLLEEIVKEMQERVPLLLKVMLSVAVPSNGKIKESIVPAIASAYSILMKHKNNNLSAYHRLTTAIAVRGGLDERAQTRMNSLGLLLSWTGRINLQDSIGHMNKNLISYKLKQNPLIKITGDNLDVYIKTSSVNREKQNKDLHLFTSNIIFSRVAKTDMDNKVPTVNPQTLNCDSIAMTIQEKEKFVEIYNTLLARIMCKLPQFLNHKNLVEEHLPHEFSNKMATKSEVHHLPILFKNEAKHEDCLAILDSYEEQLMEIYTNAFGDTGFLRKFGVPVGGDQLTRVRFQEAKSLRMLSITPEKRYDDINPIVCEMWHVKQDFVEKCYKKLYKSENSPGTLSYFKVILHRSDVTGKVKGKFQPHFDLLMLVGECMIEEQFIEFIESTACTLSEEMMGKSKEDQKQLMMSFVDKFSSHYGYGMIDTKNNNNFDITQIKNSEGQTIYIPISRGHSEQDELYNYCLQLCHWFLQLYEMHDTAKEGDLHRLLMNCQYCLPFFYSHSKLSKYLVENIDFVLKCKYFLSPLQKIRVLEGSFVNINGGKGKNVESDLTQEHSVCNQKTLIKSLGANKSEMAIKRVTGAADTLADICEKFDKSIDIKKKSGRHSKQFNSDDREFVLKTLRGIRPFHFTPGRKCPGFKNIESVPVTLEKSFAMNERINEIINRLTRGLNVVVADDEEDEWIDDITY